MLWSFGMAVLLLTAAAKGQSVPPVDCNCVAKLPVLRTNACQAVIPDLCLLATNCFSPAVVVGSPGYCNQTPPAGTIVGPGTYFITFTVVDNQGVSAQCVVPFTVTPAAGCVFSLLCASNKTVECGTNWSFDPPTWTNACSPPPGTPSNGVVLTLVSTVTNGACPQVITRTWQGVDDCGDHDQCSQTVTVVDTTPPVLNCDCITNPAVNPVFVLMTVVACTSSIPDLCLPARICAYDNCGPLSCFQSPPAGTLVGVGVHPITVVLTDCASNSVACKLNFTVVAPAGGCSSNCVTPPPGMVAWWPLDELTGATAYADVTGNGNVAIVESSGAVGNAGSPFAVPGKVLGAGYFYMPTSRGRALNAPSLNFGSGSFSADCWVNPVPTGTVHWHPIVDKLQQTGTGTGFGYKLGLLNTKVVLRVGDGTLYTYTSVGSISYTAWNFVGVAVDRVANTVTFHVNGVTESPQTLAPAGSFNSPVDLLVGGTYAVNDPYGEVAIDELELFNRALPAADFALVWNASAAGKCKPASPCTNSVVSIYCPPNTNVLTCANGAVVFYAAPVASTSCGTITNLVCVPPSGSFFPLGTNTVICTATDSQGHSASCSFTVTVTRVTVPWTVICPPLNLSVTGCPPVMPNLGNLVTIVTNCPLACPIVVTQSIAPGTVLTPGVYVVILRSCDCLGQCRDCDVVVNAVLSPGCCATVPVLRLYSGTTNNVPGVLPGGALDKQFTTGLPLFSTPNPYVPAVIHWLWLPNTAVSKWVGPTPSYAASPGGAFLYTNRFFLCSTNQASLTGRWTADDSGRIWLNGTATANVLPVGWGFTNWHPVSITSGFVPGWNELVFRVTNYSQSVTGLRTEITGSACCSQCVAITCPPNLVTNTCAGGVGVAYPAPLVTSSCGTAATVTCTPPSGSFFPVGTNVVTCTAVDAQGNAATCSFTITVVRIGKPVVVNCPPNQTLYTCGSNAVAYYKVSASGNAGPVVCTPPSGTTFPLGTNVVTCTATNACGDVASCQFLIIVKPYPLGAPAVVLQAGLPDNFVLPVEPSPQNACMVAAFSGYPYWKGFDDTAVNTLLGHRFASLPNNIVKAELVVRMKPGADSGASNDGIFVGLPACTFASFLWSASIQTLPGAGGNWNPGHPPVTFTLDLGVLNPALLTHMNTAQHLDVVIHDDTTVDYMLLRLWTCPPPHLWNGVPHWTGNGTNLPSALSALPVPVLPGLGTIGTGPAICIAPPNGNPALPNRVVLGTGGGQAFAFTTVLDLNAPEGATIVLAEVTDPEATNDPTIISLQRTCHPRCGWNVKLAKRCFADDGSEQYRSAAVNTSGDLLTSFVQTYADGETNAPLFLEAEPGITQFPLTLIWNWDAGTFTFSFPGSVARRLCGGSPCPKGWDGTIKGRVSEDLAWEGGLAGRPPGASSVTFSSTGNYQPVPRAALAISSTGLGDLVLAAEHLVTMGREVAGVADAPVMFQGTSAGDGVSWTPLADEGGVSVDLGRSASFDVGVHHFDTGDVPTQEQLFRIGGPKWPPGTTTNRPPPPPPVDLRLVSTPDGVECSADFTSLGATGVTVRLLNDGVLVGYVSVAGPLIEAGDPLLLDRWPERLAQLPGNGVLRLTSSEPFTISTLVGNEVQLIPELPPGSPAFEFYSELQCLATPGTQNLLYDLRRTPACTPVALNAARTPEGLVLTWPAEGFRLLGAETVAGPWYDLGGAAPVILPVGAALRVFRLVCQ